MEYYTLNPIRGNDGRFSAAEIFDHSKKEFRSRHFETSEKLKGQFKEPLLIHLHEETSIYSKKTSLNDILDLSFPGYIPCISDKTKALFESLNLPLEYFNIHIKGKNIEIQEGYHLTKLITPPLDCLDQENSEIIFDDFGDLEEVEKLVLDQSKIPKKTHIFTLPEMILYVPWVSETIVEKIKETNLTGFSFTAAKDYQEY